MEVKATQAGDPLYVGYRADAFWDLTHEKNTIRDWLERGVIECYQLFEPVNGLVYQGDRGL